MAEDNREFQSAPRTQQARRRTRALILLAIAVAAAGFSACASTGQPPVVPGVAKQGDGKPGTWW